MNMQPPSQPIGPAVSAATTAGMARTARLVTRVSSLRMAAASHLLLLSDVKPVTRRVCFYAHRALGAGDRAGRAAGGRAGQERGADVAEPVSEPARWPV